MKLSGNRLVERIVSQRAKKMVSSIEGPIPLVPFRKPLPEAVIALVTTAGVHLASQPVFDVEGGDASVRFIPADTPPEKLTISHTHYDRSDADRDVNCVFPLERLRELAAEGTVGSAAPTHYGLMGYIPDTKPLLEETIPAIVRRLQGENVDGVLLNPG
ncbi:glycine/sarcosine/betaine reductase selenoprotein B family protein [Bacillaceae bacterium]